MSDSNLHTLTQFFFTPTDKNQATPFARLFVVNGPLSGSHFLASKTITIGRYPDNTIHLLNPVVSKHHCKIWREEDFCYFIEDLQSKNGTGVNGRIIKPMDPLRLAHGDKITVCDTTFFFLNPYDTMSENSGDDISIPFSSALEEAEKILQDSPFLLELEKFRKRKTNIKPIEH